MALVMDTLDCLMTAIDKELSIQVNAEGRLISKANNGNFCFDEARRANTLQDGTSDGVILMMAIQRLASPRAEESLDSILTCKMWWVKAEPNRTRAVFISGTVLRSKPICNVVTDQSTVFDHCKALIEYPAVRRLHPMRRNAVDFGRG